MEKEYHDNFVYFGMLLLDCRSYWSIGVWIFSIIKNKTNTKLSIPTDSQKPKIKHHITKILSKEAVLDMIDSPLDAFLLSLFACHDGQYI